MKNENVYGNIYIFMKMSMVVSISSIIIGHNFHTRKECQDREIPKYWKQDYTEWKGLANLIQQPLFFCGAVDPIDQSIKMIYNADFYR